MILNPSWKDFELLNELLEKKNKENEKLKKALEISKEVLEIYSYLEPEQHYASTGMSDDEAVEYLKQNRYMIPKGMGGILASEALTEIKELEK